MDLHCSTDLRRHAVRRFQGRNGLDYVEVGPDQRTLHVYMLGKLPPALAKDAPGLQRFFRIEGGDVVGGIRILDADPVVDPDPEVDDVIVLRLDRRGDFSTYTLRLVGLDEIDPHYASLPFSFKVDCPSDVDCSAESDCPPPATEEPALNYLAKDYASFRQLLMDRMALLVPDWTERHAPDLGVTLVELLAYAGDYLSYYQDAVATEAYLETARQRVSVRRHVRLLDYRLHEGCNARAWVHVRVSADAPPMPAGKFAFVTALDPSYGPPGRPLASSRLNGTPPSGYEWFEPLATEAARPLAFKEAHNEIALYGWGRRNCCLEAGATRATLLDRWTGDADERALHLAVGEILLFEEVKGARTGERADADPGRRWVVRLTRVEPAEDPVYTVPGCHRDPDGERGGGRATPLVEVEWAAADALPFPLCLSSIGQAPDCPALDGVTVARGNMVLVDHGRTVRGEPLPPVPEEIVSACCDCAGQPAEVRRRAGRYRPKLRRPRIVHADPAVAETASGALAQDPRSAVPAIEVEGGAERWRAAPDLLGAGADDRLFTAEIDNEGVAQLRFGDGRLGRAPDVGVALTASYRIGGGSAGNVGPGAISRLVLADGVGIEGIDFDVRNPLAAAGGVDPEPIAQAKLHAPSAFLLSQRRAITAEDYAAAAMLDASLQRAAGTLVWTGAWWEAVVAVDPLGREGADPARLARIERRLEPLCRIGHDLSVRCAFYVPIELALSLCVLPGYDRGQVRRAVEARLVGPAGCFHPDRLSFGDGIYISRIVADAMAVAGVECATVTRLNRRFQHPDGELEAGLLPLGPHEIAQLANDPNHPECGRLQLDVGGGR